MFNQNLLVMSQSRLFVNSNTTSIVLLFTSNGFLFFKLLEFLSNHGSYIYFCICWSNLLICDNVNKEASWNLIPYYKNKCSLIDGLFMKETMEN